MRISIKCLLITGMLAITFTGCKKGGGSGPDPVVPDTTKPTITITKPTAGQVFILGSTIPFQATFTDNVKISSYEIAITNLPPIGFVLKNVPTPVPWSFSKASTSFGSNVKQQEINLSDITIPLLIGINPVVTGKYYFKVTCTDGSNNSVSTTVEININ